MTLYRKQLPQLGSHLFITDGGLETTLIFLEGIELPLFAAFDLLKDEAGTERLRNYYRRYATLAREHGHGFILESPTWRASKQWGERLGYDGNQLRELNCNAIKLMEEIRDEYATARTPFVISGCIGPHGDGYQAGKLNRENAWRYHREQSQAFAGTAADLITATTMTTVEEAIGVAMAAREFAMPVAISFTLETDGRLITGETLAEAIRSVDSALASYPAYYMVNCAHVTHFEDALPNGAELLRLRGIRANASKCSHAELDEAPALDDGDPLEFGDDYQRLFKRLPALIVLGGCCGTDHRHIASACSSLVS
jgi:homocysteine S-methyltransferase